MGEELIYRAGSRPHLIAAFGPRTAIVLNATAFTALHPLYYHQSFWAYPIAAVLYAWLFTASRSAPLTAIVHLTTNLADTLVSFTFWSLQCS